MKKIYTLLAVLFFTGAGSIYAQTHIGFGAGITQSSWKGAAVNSFNDLIDLGNGMVTTQSKTGFYAGGFVEMPLGGAISLSPGVYYSQKGYRMTGSIEGKNISFLNAGAKAEVQSHYIDVPLLIKATVAPGFQIYAGPQLSYLAKSDLKVDAGVLGISLFKRSMDITDQFSKTDWALTGGASYTFNNGFFINAGYDHGLGRVDKNQSMKSFNRTVRVGVGFTF